MHQTAATAVPVAFPLQNRSDNAINQKTSRNAGALLRQPSGRKRVYYHSEVRTPYRYAMFGEHCLMRRDEHVFVQNID